jgi:hypothetical protein
MFLSADVIGMSKRTLRQFLRFHLSTAVTLMFVAGALLYGNTQSSFVLMLPGELADFGWSSYSHPSPPEMDYILIVRSAGWPFSRHAIVAYRAQGPFKGLYTHLVEDQIVEINKAWEPTSQADAAKRAFRVSDKSRVALWYDLYNGLVAGAITILIAIGLEFSIRRRERLQASQKNKKHAISNEK